MSDPNLGVPASLAGAVDLSSLTAKRDAQPRPHGGEARDAPAVGLVVNVGDADFQHVLELSQTVPVIVDLWATWCEPCTQLTPILERLVHEHAGKLVLAKVDVDQNPQLTQAFQAQSVPTVAAVIGGRPVPLFQGALPEAEVRQVFDQVLEFAASQGIAGVVPTGEQGQDAEPEEPPLPPLHQEAFDAIERGDYAAAIAAYEKAVQQNPRDAHATAGLAQVRLLDRLAGHTADEIRGAAAEHPSDIAAQMLVADLDLSGGHVEDAFLRMLDLVPKVFGDERQDVRLRLVDMFEIVGVDDPRVNAARMRLATLLY